jgi:hypothetical protein
MSPCPLPPCAPPLCLGVQGWPALIGTDLVSSIGPARALFGAVCLGHLVRYGPDSGSHRLNCARLGAHLVLGVFGCSVGHPQRWSDFGVYTPRVVVPGADLFADARACAPKWVLAGCRALAVTLLQYDVEHAHLALPLLAMYEHVATHVTATVRCVGGVCGGDVGGWGGGCNLCRAYSPCVATTSRVCLSSTPPRFVWWCAGGWWMLVCCV